jgi:HSP20 family molecular chaperone IbpA
MSLIQPSFFQRSAFGADERTLDMFDPFDTHDMQLSSMFNWLQRPSPLDMALPHVPQKYRVTLNCAGYGPKAIKTEIQGDKLVVTGKEGIVGNTADEDHEHRSFKRTFNLPKLVERDQMTSFMDKRNGTLVIDIPYKMDESGVTAADMVPRVIDTQDGHKAVNIELALPSGIDPATVHVTVKDHDLIVKAEDKSVTPTSSTWVAFYKRSTFPENVDIKSIHCLCENNKLVVTAPLADHALQQGSRAIPIDQK